MSVPGFQLMDLEGGNRLLRLYLSEVRRYKVLAPEAEKELWKRAKIGDEEAISALTVANLRLAVWCARRYIGFGKHFGVGFLDLIQSANLGLMKAVERYDYERGCKFSFYATWLMVKSIYREIGDCGGSIRLPEYIHWKIGRIIKAREELYGKLNREPSQDEIWKASGLSLKEAGKIFNILDRGQILSLDASVNDQESDPDSRTLMDTISNPVELPEETAETEELKKKLIAALADLNSVRKGVEESASVFKAQLIITRYLGLDSALPETLEIIGENLVLSRERVRQIMDMWLPRVLKIAKLTDEESLKTLIYLTGDDKKKQWELWMKRIRDGKQIQIVKSKAGKTYYYSCPP